MTIFLSWFILLHLVYPNLIQNQRGNQKWIDAIEKDLHRNFPTHELFGGVYERIGQSELYRVLKAYSVLNPVDGYCQAMAPIAALLLMNMPAEQAFWDERLSRFFVNCLTN